MEKKKLEIGSFFIFCAGILVLTFFVFRPFFSILVLAAVLALLFRPLYIRMLKWNKKGKNLFAVLIVLISLIFIILPILFFGLQILGQAQIFFTLIQNGQDAHIQTIKDTIETLVRHVFPYFSLNVSNYASIILGFVSNNFTALISQTAYIFFEIFFMLFTLFFFVRDGDEIFYSLIALNPFQKDQNIEILESMHRTITSVIEGTLLVGIIRWVLFTIGFYIFGVHDAMIWGSIAGLIGIIPGLGTPFVIFPTVIYLVLTGNILLAIALGLFGVLIMLFIDNVLSSYFFGKGLDTSPVFILFSILGGVMFFGPLGFIFGPIILSLLISLVDMYKIIILKQPS
ncbi:MAG: AI-2E family transporter [bacterium]